MRATRYFPAAFILAAVFLLTSCAQMKPGPAFSPVDVKSKIPEGAYVQKVDNFLVLFDASGSMSSAGGGSAVCGNKFGLAKCIVNNMNQTLPTDLKLKGGLRTFGVGTQLVYGLTDYTRDGLATAVKSVNGPDGVTPIADAINGGTKDLESSTGKIAVIIVSDGLDNPGVVSPVAAAEKMKAKYGERVCIYTIQVGQETEGKELLDKIAKAGGCGFGVNADDIVSPDAMANYVIKVFLTGKAAAKPEPAPEPLKEKVSMRLAVEFDFNKSVVKAKYHDHLKSVADFLKKYPNAKLTIEGHTDSKGTDSYNQSLSQRRAASVRKYLVDKFGIDPARLTAVGYGESRPIATNDTEEGRQKNRRVMAEFYPEASK